MVSPQYLGDMWSPNCRREATLDSRLINLFRVEGLKEFRGPYNAMVVVPAISCDRRRLMAAEDLLQTYKLILYRLESVDLRRMTNDKLVFWINIHNALLMHAYHRYLKYGVPQNHLKKTSLLVKAECKIAGQGFVVEIYMWALYMYMFLFFVNLLICWLYVGCVLRITHRSHNYQSTSRQHVCLTLKFDVYKYIMGKACYL